ncbi:MAG: hypothetical protein ABIG95_01380 [Candidatus Woesearchaeota archaeon]
MEKTLFREALGDTPKLRVLELLITGRGLDYSITDIAEGAEISRTTLFRIWKDLLGSGLLVHTRKIGNAKLFKLNMKNPIARKLSDIYNEIVLKPMEEELTAR